MNAALKIGNVEIEKELVKGFKHAAYEKLVEIPEHSRRAEPQTARALEWLSNNPLHTKTLVKVFTRALDTAETTDEKNLKEHIAEIAEAFLSTAQEDLEKDLSFTEIIEYQQGLEAALKTIVSKNFKSIKIPKASKFLELVEGDPKAFFEKNDNLGQVLGYAVKVIHGLYINPQNKVIRPIGEPETKIKAFQAQAIASIDFNELIRDDAVADNTKHALRYLRKNNGEFTELIKDFVRISKENTKGQIDLEKSVTRLAANWVHPQNKSRIKTEQERLEALVDAFKLLSDRIFTECDDGYNYSEIEEAFSEPIAFFSNHGNLGVLVNFAVAHLKSSSTVTLEVAKNTAARVAKEFKNNAVRSLGVNTIPIPQNADEATQAAVRFLQTGNHLSTIVGKFVTATKEGNTFTQADIEATVRSVLQDFVNSDAYNAPTVQDYRNGLIQGIEYILQQSFGNININAGVNLLNDAINNPEGFFTDYNNTGKILSLATTTLQGLSVNNNNQVVSEITDANQAAVLELVNAMASHLPNGGAFTKKATAVGISLGTAASAFMGATMKDLKSSYTPVIAMSITIFFLLIGLAADYMRRGNLSEKKKEQIQLLKAV